MHGINMFMAEETAGEEPDAVYGNNSDMITLNGTNKPSEENVGLTEEVNELRNKLFKTEERLRNFEDANVDLRAQLAMEKSKRTLSKSERYDSEEWKQICEQIKYKDNRIIELNNVIMEKERRIIDLQEQCCSQGQAALSKKMAMQIVSRRLQELDGRVVKDVGTETDASMFHDHEQRPAVQQPICRPPSTNTSLSAKSSARGRSFSPPIVSSIRNDSPGRAIPHHRPPAIIALSSSVSKGSSPPPVDPSEDITAAGSWLSENAVSENGGGRLSPRQSRKFTTLTTNGGGNGRKRVTFDLIANAEMDDKASLKFRLTDEQSKLMAENEQLRMTVTELERKLNNHVDAQFDNGDVTVAKDDKAIAIVVNRKNVTTTFANLEKTGKVQVIKARAVAQSRVRELEDNIFNLQAKHSKDLELMHSSNESLKTSRDWMLNENANLLKRNEEMRVKIDDLLGELDATMTANSSLRQRLDDADKKIDALGLELGDVRRSLHATTDVKHILLGEVERLKEALVAQEKYASMLESDIVVYEAHVGILKDTLGNTTKTEDREIIKSKAFKAKLSALEVEKKEIAKRSNDDRLKIKALSVKVRCLEQERDDLLRRFQHTTSLGVISSSASLHDQQHRDSLPPLIHPQARSAADHQQLRRETSSTTALKESIIESSEASSDFPSAAVMSTSRLMASCSPFTPIGADGVSPSLCHSTPGTSPTPASLEAINATHVDVNSGTANRSLGPTQSHMNYGTASRLIPEDNVNGTLMLPISTNFVKPMAVVASNAHAVVTPAAALTIFEQLRGPSVDETGPQHHDECLANEALLKRDFEAKMADLHERNGQLETELQKIFTENSNLHSQLLSGTREIQSLKNGLLQIVVEISDSTGEADSTTVEQQLNALHQLVVEFRQKTKTLSDELQKVQRDAEMEKQKLVNDLTLGDAKMMGLEEEKKQIVAEKVKVEANKAELETELEYLKRVALADRDQKLSAADARLAELSVRLRDVEAQLEADREHHNIMRDGKQRLEFQLEETDKRLLEIMVEKEHVDQRIVALQEDNAFLSATLAREKERLNRLVDLLRREVDRFRVEAEVSRNCLDDLRQNSSHNLLQRLPQSHSQPPLSAGKGGNQVATREDAAVERSIARHMIAEQQFPSKDEEKVHLSEDNKVSREEVESSQSSTILPTNLTSSDVYLSQTNENEEKSVETVNVEHNFHAKGAPAEVEAEHRHQVNVQYANEFLAMSTVVNAENDDEKLSLIRGEFCKPIIPKEDLSSTMMNTSATEDGRLLTKCVAESESMEEHLTANINELMELNGELEMSVDVLKAEIWSLNNQMCKQLFDNEYVLEKLKKCEQCLMESTEQLAVKTRTVEELKSALSATCNEMERIYGERSRMEQELTEFVERCHRLQEQVNDQRHRLIEFEQSSQRVDSLESANDALRQKLSDDEALIETLNRELELRAEQLLGLETDRSQVSEQSDRLAKKLHELEQSYAGLLAKVEVEKAEKCVDCSLDAADQSSESNNSEAVDSEKAASSQKKRRPRSTTTGHATTTSQNDNSSSSNNVKNRWLDPIHMKLAILAARFDAKSADNEALFRVNAELAHTNSRLQTTIEELEAKVESLSSASTTSSQLSLRRNGAGGGRSEDEEGTSLQPFCRMLGSSGGGAILKEEGVENPCRIAEEPEEEAEAHHFVEDGQKSSYCSGEQAEESQLEALEEEVETGGRLDECNSDIFNEYKCDMIVQEQLNNESQHIELEKAAEEPRVVVVDLSISALESSEMTVHSMESNNEYLETVDASFCAAKPKKVKKTKKSQTAEPIQQLAESIGKDDSSVPKTESQVAASKFAEHTTFSFNGGCVATRLFNAVGSAASAAKSVVSAAVKDITIREEGAANNEEDELDVVLRRNTDGLAPLKILNKHSSEEDAEMRSGLDLLQNEELLTPGEIPLNNEVVYSADVPHRIVKRTKSNEMSANDVAVAKTVANDDSWNEWDETDDEAQNGVPFSTSKDCGNLVVADDNEWAPNSFYVKEVDTNALVRGNSTEPAEVATCSAEWGDSWGDDVDAGDETAWNDCGEVDSGSMHNDAENAENESWDW